MSDKDTPAPEPVAWMHPEWPNDTVYNEDAFEMHPVDGWVPLYTHPAAPATADINIKTGAPPPAERVHVFRDGKWTVHPASDADAIPVCHCAEYYGSHAPDCPVRAAVEQLVRERDNAIRDGQGAFDLAKERLERAVRAEQEAAALRADADRIMALVSAKLKAEDYADPAPAVWIQSDHLEKARHAPFLCRVEPTRRLPDFVPLYTHPAAPAIEQLMRENFTLAAGQCIVDGGLIMGEYGHGVCTMKERAECAERELATSLESERLALRNNEGIRRERDEARELLTGCATVLRIIASGRRGEEYPYAQTRGGSMIEVAALLARIDAAIQPGLSKGEDECS